MGKLLGVALFSVMLCFNVRKSDLDNQEIRKDINWSVILMLIPMILLCGLRTEYNDTGTYEILFNKAVSVQEFLLDKENYNLLSNPAYNFFQSFFKQYISNNFQLYLLVIAGGTISSFVLFIRKFSSNMGMSMIIFFAIGLYLFNFAALKQSIAMAILVTAIPQLLKKKYVKFSVLLVVAILFHSYAIMYIILPLFVYKPWSKQTYLTIIVMLFILFTFENTITNLLEYAEVLGKDISEEEVFNTASINLLRLAVYAIPPLMAFVFQKYLKPYYNPTINVLINMSIFSFLILVLGTVSAGNLFARCAIYFEIGTICIFPWIVEKIFEKKSKQIILTMASICYIAFFLYDNIDFEMTYRGMTLIQFLQTMI